jgi:valyl-tRNA synthetase
MAPHISEELWQALGHPESIAYAPWPAFDPKHVLETNLARSKGMETIMEKVLPLLNAFPKGTPVARTPLRGRRKRNEDESGFRSRR